MPYASSPMTRGTATRTARRSASSVPLKTCETPLVKPTSGRLVPVACHRRARRRRKPDGRRPDERGSFGFSWLQGWLRGHGKGYARRSCTGSEGVLPPVFPADYLSLWGPPSSPRRLSKMAESIASFAPSAKRRDENRLQCNRREDDCDTYDATEPFDCRTKPALECGELNINLERIAMLARRNDAYFARYEEGGVFPDDLQAAITNRNSWALSCCVVWPGHQMDLPGEVGIVLRPTAAEQVLSVAKTDLRLFPTRMWQDISGGVGLVAGNSGRNVRR